MRQLSRNLGTSTSWNPKGLSRPVLDFFNFIIISIIIIIIIIITTVELGYNVMKGPEYFVSLYTSVFITEYYNVTVTSEEFIGTTEYITV
jgi:hypothetical protein